MEEAQRPWLRLWRRGSAAFQQLEPHHRGTLLEILRYTDAHGRIALSGRTPEEALLRLLGNTRSFRPVLRAALAEGLRIGMCVVADDTLSFPSWTSYQPSAPKPSKRGATTEQAQGKSRAAAEQEQSNDRAPEAKSTESLNTQNDTRGEKRRAEQNRSGVVGLASSEPSATKALTLALAEPPKRTPADVVFSRWLEVTGRTARTDFSAARRKRIEWALKTYGLDETLAALVGLSRSDWNMGRDPKSNGETYTDLTLVLRDATHFERFRDRGLAPEKPAATGPLPPSDASKFRVMSLEERRARLTGGAA